MRSGLFPAGRAGVCSTSATVIADVVVGCVVDHGLVVDIVNVRDVHVVHRAVVVEAAVPPISPLIADTSVAVAVVDSAVEAYMLAPVTAIPGVGAAAPPPVARRPEITVSRSHRLRVHRQGGRRDRDGHTELRERGGRYGQYQKYQQQT